MAIFDESETDQEQMESSQRFPMPIRHFFLFAIFLQFAHSLSNAAITSLLRFFKFFIKALGVAFQCEPLVHAADTLPIVLGTVHKMLGTSGDTFEKYVVCRKCHSVYHFEDCINRRGFGGSTSKLCHHIAYPNHPQPSRRTSCDTLLLKTVRNKHGVSLQPFKVYPYRSVRDSIASLVGRPGFLEECEKWHVRSTRVPSSYMGDIYDGCIWRNFNSSSMLEFLGSPFCYLLTLNVDWFQPFERDVYSLGAIYLTIQNLPRNIRYKPENIILVGIMPGPKEASCNINSYLGPLVLELQEAWNSGFCVKSSQ